MCSLPKIEFGEKPDISHEELNNMIALNITKEDQMKICEFKKFIDLQNIKAFWQNLPIDNRGNLNEKEIEEALLVGELLPHYVFDFIQKYKNNEDRIKNFPIIYSNFWQEEINKSSGFLNDYFSFERECRLILTALRAKEQKRDFLSEIFFEDSKDFLISSLISQKGTEDFGFMSAQVAIRDIFNKNKDNPDKLNFLFLQYRFKYINSIHTSSSFDINAVLKFLALLYLVEDTIADRTKQILNTLC
jgi:hypothetical protein